LQIPLVLTAMLHRQLAHFQAGSGVMVCEGKVVGSGVTFDLGVS